MAGERKRGRIKDMTASSWTDVLDIPTYYVSAWFAERRMASTCYFKTFEAAEKNANRLNEIDES